MTAPRTVDPAPQIDWQRRRCELDTIARLHISWCEMFPWGRCANRPCDGIAEFVRGLKAQA